MAENYVVNYKINVNSSSAQTALSNFQKAVSNLAKSDAEFKTVQDKINKLSASLAGLAKNVPVLKIDTNTAKQKLDAVIKKLQTINRLARQDRSLLGGLTGSGGSSNGGNGNSGGNGGKGGGKSKNTGRTKKVKATDNAAYKAFGPTPLPANGGIAIDMLKGMGIAYGVSGVTQAISEIVDQAVTYDNTMKTVENILKSHDNSEGFAERFQSMTQTVRNVGMETKFKITEVADAAKFLAMAGLDLDAIKKSIRPIADIALVGDTDLGQTADLVTNIMTAYNIKPEKMRNAADVMTNTFTMSNTTLTEIAESYKYAASLLSAGGIGFEEATAAIGILGDAGIKGSQAGTTLRTIMSNIVNPTAKQAKAWKAVGISTKDKNGETKSMMDIFQELNAKNLNVADYYKLFHKTAAAGAVALADHVDKWNNIYLENFASSGITATLADEKKNTLQGLWAQLTSVFTDTGVTAFQNVEGGLRLWMNQIIDWLKSDDAKSTFRDVANTMMEFMNLMIESTKRFAKLFDIFAPFIKLWVKFQLVIWPVVKAIQAFKSVLSGLTWLRSVANEIKGATTCTMSLGDAFERLGSLVSECAKTFFTKGWSRLRAFVSIAWTGAKNYASKGWNAISTNAPIMWNNAKGYAQKGWSAFNAYGPMMLSGIKSPASVMGNIKKWGQSKWQRMTTRYMRFPEWPAWKADFDDAVNERKRGLKHWQGIYANAKRIKAVGPNGNPYKKILANINRFNYEIDRLNGLYERKKLALNLQGAGIDLRNFANGAWDRTKSGVWNGLQFIGNGAKTVGDGIWSGVKVAGNGIWNGSKAIGNAIWNGTKATGNGLWNGTKAIGAGVLNGVKFLGKGIVNNAGMGIGALASYAAMNQMTREYSNRWDMLSGGLYGGAGMAAMAGNLPFAAILGASGLGASIYANYQRLGEVHNEFEKFASSTKIMDGVLADSDSKSERRLEFVWRKNYDINELLERRIELMKELAGIDEPNATTQSDVGTSVYKDFMAKFDAIDSFFDRGSSKVTGEAAELFNQIGKDYGLSIIDNGSGQPFLRLPDGTITPYSNKESAYGQTVGYDVAAALEMFKGGYRAKILDEYQSRIAKAFYGKSSVEDLEKIKSTLESKYNPKNISGLITPDAYDASWSLAKNWTADDVSKSYLGNLLVWQSLGDLRGNLDAIIDWKRKYASGVYNESDVVNALAHGSNSELNNTLSNYDPNNIASWYSSMGYVNGNWVAGQDGTSPESMAQGAAALMQQLLDSIKQLGLSADPATEGLRTYAETLLSLAQAYVGTGDAISGSMDGETKVVNGLTWKWNAASKVWELQSDNNQLSEVSQGILDFSSSIQTLKDTLGSNFGLYIPQPSWDTGIQDPTSGFQPLDIPQYGATDTTNPLTGGSIFNSPGLNLYTNPFGGKTSLSSKSSSTPTVTLDAKGMGALTNTSKNSAIRGVGAGSDNTTTKRNAPKSSDYKNHYKNSSAAPKQVIVRIGNLMSVDKVDLSNPDKAAVVSSLKSELAQALVDVVHDFDETWHG